MRKTALAFGAFDIIHYGHVRYLREAKRHADRLIVVVARDRSVELLKHRKPFFDENTRLRMVGSLRMVDKAVLGNIVRKPSDRYNIIKKYRPDVVVFGYDQRVSADAVRKWLRQNNLKAKVVRLKEGVDTDVFKSSKIRKRLVG